MTPERRASLVTRVAAAIDRYGGRVLAHYRTHTYFARRVR
jgi:hypothetical protein